jgi:hypothetical protein
MFTQNCACLGDDTYFVDTFNSYIRLDLENTLLPCSIRMKPFTQDGINFKIYVCLKERR